MFRQFLYEARQHRCGGPGPREREFRREESPRGERGWAGECGPGKRGRWGGRPEGGPFGRGAFGGGRERIFDGGTMRLVILKLLSEEPSYGYQLIKRLEERMAGGYTPSAGVIYPTLTMLEEQGLIAPTTNDAGKKVFAVTDEGKAFLEANKERLAHLEAIMNVAGRGFARGRSPEIMQAFMALRGAVKNKVTRENLTAEQVQKIAEAIEAAAKAIDGL